MSVEGGLSDDAKRLLRKTEGDDTIDCVVVIGRKQISAGGENFTDGSNRSGERWLAAIRELETAGLIEDRAGKGELYFVTHKGFQAIDLIKADDSPPANKTVLPEIPPLRGGP